MKRFWDKVDKSGECWIWTACKTQGKYGGYGRFAIKPGKVVTAHRVSYELTRGAIPDGMMVCHTCDNPSCVNPEHLFLGTQFDNMRDMVAKGRHADHRGERHPKAKLTKSDVKLIRLMHGPSRVIAEKFGVSTSLIAQIRSRKAWSHI